MTTAKQYFDRLYADWLERVAGIEAVARNAALEEAAKAVENTAYVEYQAGCKAPSNESVRSILAQAAAAIREKIK